jgi:hypothetical protein
MLCDALCDAVQERSGSMWVWDSHVSTRWASQHASNAALASLDARASSILILLARSVSPATSISIVLAPQLLLLPLHHWRSTRKHIRIQVMTAVLLAAIHLSSFGVAVTWLRWCARTHTLYTHGALIKNASPY